MEADVIYIAASQHDARLTRICVASVRTFYPSTKVRILAGGPLNPRLVRELRQHWDIDLASVPAGEYGWGFVKLEPLFDQASHRFLVLDSDTVLSGPVLDVWRASKAPFLVDRETQSDADMRRLYFDWERLARLDPNACRPDFVFNSGQWFGTSGILTREEFAPWIEWTMPRRLRHPAHFMPGDQGVLNYVLNIKSRRGEIAVDRVPLMVWPGHGMGAIDRRSVVAGTCPPRVIHWAGMKRLMLRRMAGADILQHFERRYYRDRSGGWARRQLAIAYCLFGQTKRAILVRLTLGYRKHILGRRSLSSHENN